MLCDLINILIIICFIILLDISPLLFECCPYVGNVQVIEIEGCIPSIVQVGVTALICNTQGDERFEL